MAFESQLAVLQQNFAFCSQSLELLLQAHVQELAKATKEEPVSEKHPSDAACTAIVETTMELAIERNPPTTTAETRQTKDTQNNKSNIKMEDLYRAAEPEQATSTEEMADPGTAGGFASGEESAEVAREHTENTMDAQLMLQQVDIKAKPPPKGMFHKILKWIGSHNPHGHTNEVAMFGNMKDQLKDGHDIDEFEYDVADFYHKAGCAQSTARSDWFGHLSLFFICANAVYLGVDSDINRAESLSEADIVWVIGENIFCVFFTIEVTVRFAAFREKRNCLKDTWFKFDTTLVCIMILETWALPLIVHLSGGANPLPTGPLKLVRLLRLARMVRIMRAFPELMTMVKGMMVATRPVFSSMAMLVGIMYVFALTMHMLCREDGDVYEYWGTVSRCMMTLLANGTLGDSIGTVMRGIAKNVPALVAFIVFVILSAVTVTNMLIGVLCEVVSHVAEAEKEYAVLSKLKATLLVMLKRLDEDGNGDISKHELHGIMKDEDALQVLDELQINVDYFVERLDMVYEDTETLTIPDIMQLLLDNQGDRPPNLKDITLMHNFTRWSLKRRLKEDNEHLRLELAQFQGSLFMLPTSSRIAHSNRNNTSAQIQMLGSSPQSVLPMCGMALDSAQSIMPQSMSDSRLLEM